MSATTKTESRLLRVLLAVLASFLLLAAGCAADEEAGNAASEKDEKAVAEAASSEEGVWPVAEVALRVEPSVVQVNISSIQTTPYGQREAQGLGSGVIFREDGYVITNNHVVEGANTVNVAFADGSVETGRVVGTDPFTDIAVIKVSKENLPSADFADGGDLVVGQLAVAIGNPSGFQSTVTSGIVSGLHREIPPEIAGGSQQSALVDLIQTDAAISPGSSGGTLVGRDAKVVGINVAYLPPAQTGAALAHYPLGSLDDPLARTQEFAPST